MTSSSTRVASIDARVPLLAGARRAARAARRDDRVPADVRDAVDRPGPPRRRRAGRCAASSSSCSPTTTCSSATSAPDLGEPDDDGAWRTMSLADIVGTGVMADAVASARELDAKFPEATPYLDLYDGELAYRRGDYAKAAELAKAGLAKLPQRGGAAALPHARAGRPMRCAGSASSTRARITRCCSGSRRSSHPRPRVPVRDRQRRLGRRRARPHAAPRLATVHRGRHAPFTIHARSVDGVVELCLTDTSGLPVRVRAGTQDDAVMLGARRVPRCRVLAEGRARQIDLSSLDGSPVRVSADQVVKGILGP